MTISKEFIESTLKDFETSKQVDDNFLQLMYDYYNSYFPLTKNYINGFGEFKNMLYLWVNTPIIKSTDMQDIFRPMKQTMNKGVNNTVNHFKQKIK